jgi:hypothetical protein
VTNRPTTVLDAELRELARDLDREADRWRELGLSRLADLLRFGADFARGSVGAEEDEV